MAADNSSFPYHEPNIETVLILTALLLLLNICNYILDRLVYCGLLGQILIGTWFGTSGTKWLGMEIEHAVQVLGYLGLVLLVFEGGLNTSTKPLKANLVLSVVVALTGICTPIALSFILKPLLSITSLQAFAAGVALCSTSLGTTFTVLSTSGLTESRLGVVLTSAAMMDDVVGLVMVKVISALGSSQDDFNSVVVIRPVFVSIAFAVLLPLLCTWIVGPCFGSSSRLHTSSRWRRLSTRLASDNFCFIAQSLYLVAMVSGATYAGTSGLFAAYLAGVSITWFDKFTRTLPVSSRTTSTPSTSVQQTAQTERCDPSTETAGSATIYPQQDGSPSRSSALQIYEKYYKPSVDTVFKPFFFASIGFSIPITEMFTGSIVWKGFVYAALMAFGKIVCGIWLIRIPGISIVADCLARLTLPKSIGRWYCARAGRKERQTPKQITPATSVEQATAASSAVEVPSDSTSPEAKDSKDNEATENAQTPQSSLSVPPLSLYPAAILGGAMVARGEIGFLISSVAESSGIFTNELFLVVTWAIFLCTFIGPLLVGSLVKRVTSLQSEERSKNSGKMSPLGEWGVLNVDDRAT